MLRPSVKLLCWILGMLLMLLPESSIGQSENDSTFDAIDYFSGRIIPGFGGGFDQTFFDDRDGRQRFITTPSLYGSLNSKLGIQISHTTEWPKDNMLTFVRADSAFIDVLKLEPTKTKTSRMQIQWRPAPELQLVVSSSLVSSEQNRHEEIELAGVFRGEYNSRDEADSEQLSLSAVYLNHNGQLALKPAQLGWLYYGNETHPILQSGFISPICFLEKGQTMLSFSGSLNNSHTEQTSMQKEDSPTRSSSFKTDTETFPLNLSLLNCVNDNLTVGFELQAVDETGTSESASMGYLSSPEAFRGSNHTKQVKLGPHLDFAGSEKFLHRIEFVYDKSRFTTNGSTISSDSTVQESDSFEFERTWSLGYALHHFGNVPPPSLPAYLANWNNDFGNRLPARGLHLRWEIFFRGEKAEMEYGYVDGQHQIKRDSRSMDTQFAANFGVSNWLELAWEAQLTRNWTRLSGNDSESGLVFDLWRNSVILKNALLLSFANYRYSERLRHRFSWNEMSTFDQLYGTLLLPGMFNVTVAYEPNYLFTKSWVSEDIDYFDFHFPNRWTEKYWFLETKLRFGFTGNLQFAVTGKFSGKYRRNILAPHDDGITGTVSWQPWSSVRLEASHFFETDDKPLYERDNIWNFRVLTLF